MHVYTVPSPELPQIMLETLPLNANADANKNDSMELWSPRRSSVRFFFPKEGITLPREALVSGRIRHGLDFVSSSHRAREGRGEFSVQVMDHMAALLLHVLPHLCVK